MLSLSDGCINLQQASQLADKNAGGLRLGKEIHIWKGLEQNLRLEGTICYVRDLIQP